MAKPHTKLYNDCKSEKTGCWAESIANFNFEILSEEDEEFPPNNPIESLPPEMMNAIFNFLTLDDKKTVRLCCKFWKNIVNERTDTIFRVKLNNDTAELIILDTDPDAKFKFKLAELKLKLHYLVENLTLDSDSNLKLFEFLDSTDNIAAVTIGSGNSAQCFDKILEICGHQNVQNLKFERNSITSLIQVNVPPPSKKWTLASVTTLTIEIGPDGDRKWEAGTDDFAEYDGSISWKTFQLFKNLILQNLENVFVNIDLNLRHFPSYRPSNYRYPERFLKWKNVQLILSRVFTFLNEHQNIKRLTFRSDIPEHVSFLRWPHAYGSPKLDCPALKYLRLESPYGWSIGTVVTHLDRLPGLKTLEIHCNDKLRDNAENLISNHADTLHSILINSYDAHLWESSHLWNSMTFQKLTLIRVVQILVQFSRPCRSLLYGVSNNFSRNFDTLKNLLERGGERDVVEEVIVIMPKTPEDSEYIGWSKLHSILSLPNIKKLVLNGLDKNFADFLAKVCNNQMKKNPRLLINIKQCNNINGKVDFSICVAV